MELLLPQGWPRALSASTDGEICEKGIYICDSKHLTCQVCNKFVDRIAEEVAMGGTAEEALEQIKARQIAFLKRDAAEAGLASRPAWKASKIHRVGARNWILHMDNQACQH